MASMAEEGNIDIAIRNTMSFVRRSNAQIKNNALTDSSGALHILLVLFGRKHLFWDLEEYERYLRDWSKIEDVGKALSTYPTDFTRNVSPIPCHSHNDYWRKRPLFDAVQWGCTSVEVDVWHFDREDELFVGHNTASLTRTRTFKNLYVDPLVDILDSM